MEGPMAPFWQGSTLSRPRCVLGRPSSRFADSSTEPRTAADKTPGHAADHIVSGASLVGRLGLDYMTDITASEAPDARLRYMDRSTAPRRRGTESMREAARLSDTVGSALGVGVRTGRHS